MTDDIHFATVAELAKSLAAKQFSSLELTQAFLSRLQSLGPRYNAVAHLTEEPALEAARRADGLFDAGIVNDPLQGIPCGVKDLLATKDAPTQWGAEPYRGQQFDHDATVVERLRAAGAAVAAKLAMVELAGGGGYRYASASMHGPGRNPWDRERWSGGSSSGPGSAVAAGLTPFAIGSETLGSIVTPAAFCGVTGLRPTYGYVSRHGAMALSWTMDKLGPMAHSAEDCGLVLAAISGPDSRDRSTSMRRFVMPGEPRIPLRQVRVGFAEVDFAGWPHPEARPSLREGLQALRRLGVEMREVRLPDLPYGDAASMVIRAEAATVFEKLIRSNDLDKLPDERQKAGLRAALETPATAYLNAMRIRTLALESLGKLFEDADLIAGPSRMTVAPPIEQPLDSRREQFDQPGDAGNRHLLAASNLTGYPALSLPCGFAGGLPVGIQLVGRPFEDDLLVSVGIAFQRETDWHRRRPAV